MIYGLIAGILHLCNIEFAQDPEMGHVIIMNEETIDYSKTLSTFLNLYFVDSILYLTEANFICMSLTGHIMVWHCPSVRL